MMKKAIVLVVFLLSLTTATIPCCWTSAGDPVWMASEKALIIWDEKKRIQHFIRQASFDTEARDFGFIVPLPSVPDFAVADDHVFERLQQLKPRPVINLSCSKGELETPASADGIEVLKSERVGDYQATVLKAADGSSMNGWLKANGFKTRPQMTEWLNHYSQKQWLFAALKYVAKPDETTQTKALRISFKTEKPHYPYKMPSDAFKPGWVRPLNLYVISTTGVDARFLETGNNWQGEHVWSRDLSMGIQSEVAGYVKLASNELPKSPILTVFKNASNESKYDDDLVFVPTSNFGLWLWGGFATILILAWILTLRKRGLFTVAKK